MENNSRKFFFFSAAIGILIFSGDKIYRLWQVKHDAQVLQEQLVEKREWMDKFYVAEFDRIYSINQNAERSLLQMMQFNNSIKATEAKMVQDGYSNAEIGAIKNRGFIGFK